MLCNSSSPAPRDIIIYCDLTLLKYKNIHKQNYSFNFIDKLCNAKAKTIIHDFIFTITFSFMLFISYHKFLALALYTFEICCDYNNPFSYLSLSLPPHTDTDLKPLYEVEEILLRTQKVKTKMIYKETKRRNDEERIYILATVWLDRHVKTCFIMDNTIFSLVIMWNQELYKQDTCVK